jgi:hypothetical protein
MGQRGYGGIRRRLPGAYCHTHSDSNAYTNSDSYADPDASAHPDADTYSNTVTDAYSDRWTGRIHAEIDSFWPP